jgi:hypothetical protein
MGAYQKKILAIFCPILFISAFFIFRTGSKIESNPDYTAPTTDSVSDAKIRSYVQLHYNPPKELTYEEASQQSNPYKVSVLGPGKVLVAPGVTAIYPFTVNNLGDNSDTYTLSVSSSQGWADIENVPKSITLRSGESKGIKIKMVVPEVTPVGTTDVLKLIARSEGSLGVFDTATGETTVSQNITTYIFSWIPSFFLNLLF